MTTPYLAADLKSDEGLRLHAYPDPLTHGAPFTIGWGHTGPEVRLDSKWSLHEAEDALARDIATAIHGLDARLAWWRQLDDVRQDVLANMAFNLGLARLKGFVRTLAFVKAGAWAPAAEGMLASAWARQVGGRATRLAEQMRTGVRAAP